MQLQQRVEGKAPPPELGGKSRQPRRASGAKAAKEGANTRVARPATALSKVTQVMECRRKKKAYGCQKTQKLQNTALEIGEDKRIVCRSLQLGSAHRLVLWCFTQKAASNSGVA